MLEREQRLQSLGLARVELLRQSDVSAHPIRRQQLALAIAELDRRIAALTDEGVGCVHPLAGLRSLDSGSESTYSRAVLAPARRLIPEENRHER